MIYNVAIHMVFLIYYVCEQDDEETESDKESDEANGDDKVMSDEGNGDDEEIPNTPQEAVNDAEEILEQQQVMIIA